MSEIPDSFCAMCTKNCSKELLGLLLSLSHHHPNASMYVMSDTHTKNFITKNIPDIKLVMHWIVTLDKYSNMNRNQMVKQKIWSDFQMSKAKVISFALENEKDTLFMDSDLFILGKINNVDKSKELGVSPHYMIKNRCDRYGYYNGGLLWVKNKNIPNKWIEYTKTSRYFDQASIEDLAKEFDHFEFKQNYNLGQWRFSCDKKFIGVKEGKIMFDKNELKIIHIHFHKYTMFKNLIINKLKLLNRVKEIEFIDKILSTK